MEFYSFLKCGIVVVDVASQESTTVLNFAQSPAASKLRGSRDSVSSACAAEVSLGIVAFNGAEPR